MRIKRQTRWAAKATALAAVVALSLTACGGNGAAGGSGGEDEDIALRFVWWGSDIRHEGTQKVIDEFEAENPNITIEGEFGDWSGYWDKLATMVAGGTAPDIIQMDQRYIAEYAGRGALLDLSEQEELDLSNLDANSVAAGETQGGLYGISSGVNSLVILANPALFEAAGVEMPDDTTWTWDDYASIAQEITENTPEGTYGASAMTSDGDLTVWLRQLGKTLYTEEGEIGFDVDDIASFFERVKTLSEQGATPPPSVITEQMNAPLEQTGTATNTIAMGGWWSNQLPAVEQASGSDLVILRRPSMTGSAEDNGIFYKASQYFSGSASTEHPEAVAKFISFLVNDPRSGNILLAERGVPINPDIRAGIEDALTPADAEVVQFISDIGPELEPAPAPPPVGGAIAEEVMNRYTSEVLFDRLSPEEAGAAVIDELNASLDAAG